MNLSENSPNAADLLVVGGGISGITAAVEAAELGLDTLLVEREPFLGGRVAQMHQYFPKLCPPLCGLEINYRRLRANDSVKVMTLTTVDSVSGGPGDYQVQLSVKPRYVNENCTSCGDCVPACSIEVPDEFNYGLNTRKTIYTREMAYPPLYVVDPHYVQDERMKACVEACKYGAIELDQKPMSLTVKVKGLVWATGWQPYDANRLDNLGYGQLPNVITNVILERLAASDGPTGGKIIRPSDQAAVGKIAFVQCAGSRDENHLAYCSGVCCAASLKQARYIREQYPEAEIHLFYIDVRTPGRLEDFYAEAQKDGKMFFHRGKVAEIRQGNSTGSVIVAAENTITGKITEMEVDMAVLAVGMAPNAAQVKPPLDTPQDDWGFVLPQAPSGIVGAGVASRPLDVAASVQDATGAVMRTLLNLGK
jgi:quinone-modifying oxidoreductase subunit QmoA